MRLLRQYVFMKFQTYYWTNDELRKLLLFCMILLFAVFENKVKSRF